MGKCFPNFVFHDRENTSERLWMAEREGVLTEDLVPDQVCFM
jgi:hypothetical protein